MELTVFFIISLITTFLLFKTLQLLKEGVMEKRINSRGHLGNNPALESVPIGRQQGWRRETQSGVQNRFTLFSLSTLVIALMALAFLAFTPTDSQATNSFNNLLNAQFTGGPSTCGKCHGSWNGQQRRNNFGLMRILHDASVNIGATEGAYDADFDGVDTMTESVDNFGGWPDSDQDGYISLHYRFDASGLVHGVNNMGGNYTPDGTIVKGWDMDDRDAGQGNWAWDANPDGVADNNTNDSTPPSAITDLRANTLSTGALNLQWTATGDDGAVGTAHSFDIRYVDVGNTGPSTGYNLRASADWLTMWDLPDCDVDDTTGALDPVTTAGTLDTAIKCSNGGDLWNTGKVNPLMRVLAEPPAQAATTPQSMSVTTVGTIQLTNVITNGTTYWVAMRAWDGVTIPNLFDGATILVRENLSPLSNIVAITAGDGSSTGVGISGFSTTSIPDSSTAAFDINGYGFTNLGTAQVTIDSQGSPVTCTVNVSTDILINATDCNVTPLDGSGATYYDVDILDGGTLKAAWLGAVNIGVGGDSTDVGDLGGAVPSNSYANADAVTRHVSSFNISTTTTDSVSEIYVTRAGTGVDGDVTMTIYLDGGNNTYDSGGADDTQVCTGVTFSSNIASCLGLTEGQTSTAKNYYIALTTSTPGNGTHTAAVSSISAGNSGSNGDNPDATLTVDTNAPTSNIRGDTGSYTFGNWAGGPGNTEVSVDMDTAADVGPAGIAATYPKYCTGTSCSPSTTYASAFNVPASPCADGSTCSVDVGYRTDDNATNSDVGSVTVNIDMQGPTPAGDFAAVSASGTQCDVTYTARTGGDDLGAGALDGSPYKVVRALSPANPAADCSDSDIVRNWSALSSTINDGGVSNPNTYNYRVCYKDSLGNISNEATSCSPSSGPTLTIVDGGVTADSFAAASDTRVVLGGFGVSLANNLGSTTFTAVTVDLGGQFANAQTVYIHTDGAGVGYTNDTDDPVIGSAAVTLQSTTVTPGAEETVFDDSTNNYLVTVDTDPTVTDSETLSVDVTDITTGWGAETDSDNADGTTAMDQSPPTTTAAVSGYTFGNWTGGSGNDQLTVDLTESDAGPSGVLGGSTEYCFGTSAGCSSFTTGTSFSVPLSVCGAGSTCENYINYRSTDNVGNVQAATQDEFIRIDMAGPTPAGDFAAVSASATQCDVTYTARTGGDDPGAGALDGSPYKVVRALSPANPAADCSDSTIVRGWSALSTTINDTGVANPNTYNYRVCYKDSLGNISNEATSCSPSAASLTQATNDPAATSDKQDAGGGTNLAVGTFRLKVTSGANDTVTSITVSSAGTLADSNVSAVRIWKDVDTNREYSPGTDTQVGSDQTFTSGTADFTSLSETATLAGVDYIITYTISASGDGTLQGSVSAITAATNGTNAPDAADGTITVDVTGPSTGSVSINAAAAYTNNKLTTLTISCTDATTTCNEMMIEDDSGFVGGIWEAYNTTKASYDIDPTLGGDGTKTVWIKFRDDVNNGSGSFSDAITLDTTSPDAPTLAGPTDLSYTSDTTPEFSWNAVVTDTSGIATYDIQVDDNTNFLTPAIDESAGASSPYTSATALTNGVTYYWRIRANDNAGNPAGAWSGYWTLTIDTTVPTVVGAPTGGSESTGVNATATFSLGPIDCTTVTTGSFYMEETITTNPVAATIESCVGEVATLNPTSNLTGNLGYTVYVTAAITDLAGNTLAPTSWSFTTTGAVDAADPTFTGAMGGVDDGTATGDSVTLTWDEGTDDLTTSLNMVYYVCELIASGGCNLPGNFTDDYGPVLGSGADCTGGGGTCSYTITGLTEGDIYYYRVRAVDEVSKTTIHATEVTVIPYDRTLSVNMYNMVSVPGDLDGSSTPQNIFFTDDLTGAYQRTLYWNTGTNRYGLTLAGTALIEGEGYWLLRYLHPSNVIDIDAVGGDNGVYGAYTAQSTTPVDVPLVDGWNAVGNPCLTNVTGSTTTNTAATFDILLSAISASCGGTADCSFTQAVSGGFVKNTVYHWTGTSYGEWEQVSTSAGALRPWKGYWLFVYPGQTPAANTLSITCDSQ